MSKPIARVLIKKECRKNYGIEKAFDEACKEMKKSYLLWADTYSNRNRTWKLELH